MNYYNEIDPYCCSWLLNLMSEGLIPDGYIDSRSIADVTPGDLAAFTQCHFFAGIAGWPLALRLAGWPEDREIWTGSCPCQPFSVAGRRAGTGDARHLWPDMFRLIDACRPSTVFGEQVSAASGKRQRLDFALQQMWSAEAILGILQGDGHARQFEWLSLSLQGMLSGMAEELQDYFEGAEVGFFQELPKEESIESADLRRTIQSAESWTGFRSRSIRNGDSREDQQRTVRIIRDTVLSGRRENVGQPIIGQNCANGRLHYNKRTDRSILAKYNDEHVGSGTDIESSLCRSRDAGEGKVRSSEEMGGEVEGEASANWLDGVQSDLDAIGYSSRAVDIPACSVNAPQIRNRLYWVARADSPDAECTPRKGTGHGETQGAGAHSEPPGRGVHAFEAGRVEGSDLALLRQEPPAGEQSESERQYGFHQGCDARGMADAERGGCGAEWVGSSLAGMGGDGENNTMPPEERSARRDRGGFWGDWQLIGPDPEGKYRRIKSATSSVDSGVSRGMGSSGTEELTGWAAPRAVDRSKGSRSYEGCLKEIERKGQLDDLPSQAMFMRDAGISTNVSFTPLIKRSPGDVGQIRGYGNAICAPLAAEVIRAYMDVC